MCPAISVTLVAESSAVNVCGYTMTVRTATVFAYADTVVFWLLKQKQKTKKLAGRDFANVITTSCAVDFLSVNCHGRDL